MEEGEVRTGHHTEIEAELAHTTARDNYTKVKVRAGEN